MFDSPRRRLIRLLDFLPWLVLGGSVLLVGWSPQSWPLVLPLIGVSVLAIVLARRYREVAWVALLLGSLAVMVVAFSTGTSEGAPFGSVFALLRSDAVLLSLLLFSPLLLVAVLWGSRAVVPLSLALLLPIGRGATPAEFSAGVCLIGLAILSGLRFHSFLQGNEVVHQVLTDVALTEPSTGLGNLRSLRRDFRRYQAMAERNNQLLLLTRWTAGQLVVGDAGSARRHPRVGFAQALEEYVRQSDGLYYLGEDEFIGLHPRLESAHEVLERIKTLYPLAQVSWTQVGDKSLDHSLHAVREQTPEPSRSSETGLERPNPIN